MKTIYEKTSNGLRGQTTLFINPEETLELVISTYRRISSINKIVTTAMVRKVQGNCCSHILFEDYSKDIAFVPISKVTEKAVRNLHEEQLKLFEDIKNDAIAFYKNKKLL